MTLKIKQTKYYTDKYDVYHNEFNLFNVIKSIIYYCNQNYVTTISNYVGVIFGVFSLLLFLLL